MGEHISYQERFRESFRSRNRRVLSYPKVQFTWQESKADPQRQITTGYCSSIYSIAFVQELLPSQVDSTFKHTHTNNRVNISQFTIPPPSASDQKPSAPESWAICLRSNYHYPGIDLQSRLSKNFQDQGFGMLGRRSPMEYPNVDLLISPKRSSVNYGGRTVPNQRLWYVSLHCLQSYHLCLFDHISTRKYTYGVQAACWIIRSHSIVFISAEFGMIVLQTRHKILMSSSVTESASSSILDHQINRHQNRFGWIPGHTILYLTDFDLP